MPHPVWKTLCAASFLAIAGCEEPPYPVGPQNVPEPEPELTEEAAEQIQGAPPEALPPAEFYRQNVTGRWAERPNCGGMTWSFQAESFTTPGETHCAAIAVSAASADTVRVRGGECVAEGAPQSDMTLDVTVEDDRITVTGIGNPVSTPDWIRCQ